MTVSNASDQRAGASAPGRRAICPYLAADGRRWRSVHPLREQHCAAVEPPIPLTLDKQRRLCLLADHVDCATYRAAVAAEPSAAGTRWHFARTTPTVLEHGRTPLADRVDRRTAQLVLGGVLATAFGALLVGRLPTAGAAPEGAPGTESVAPVVEPSPEGTARPTRRPVPTVRPTPNPTAPSVAPTILTPSPTIAFQTYVVRAGDTLVAIAARFGTTVGAIVEANGIEDPSLLRIGQVLRIPASN